VEKTTTATITETRVEEHTATVTLTVTGVEIVREVDFRSVVLAFLGVAMLGGFFDNFYNKRKEEACIGGIARRGS
jgi:hypothetical protein